MKIKEKENLIDETDGIHIVFGMVVVPYILYNVQSKNTSEIKRLFSFIENMAMCEDKKINEGHDTLNQCKRYMGMNTLKHCEKVEKYFL